ncbi:MAG: hypothetical protein KBC41_03920 [Candidatus Pacebacteria bacterium]|nr:hypothetical protein [Candidatus Paceibacterota bacterium]MBP9867191.1 hypothetical protein [Candidatus Paceibacterota bacterium]
MTNKKRTNQKITNNMIATAMLKVLDDLEGEIDAFFEEADNLLKKKDLSKANSQKIKESMQNFLDSMFEKSPSITLQNFYRNYIGKDTE